MDIFFAAIFIIISFLCFIIGLFEERVPTTNTEDEREKNYFIVIFLGIGTGLFILTGIILLGITQTYYDLSTGSLETLYLSEYRPFGWVFIGIGMICLIFTSSKVMELLGSIEEE